MPVPGCQHRRGTRPSRTPVHPRAAPFQSPATPASSQKASASIAASDEGCRHHLRAPVSEAKPAHHAQEELPGDIMSGVLQNRVQRCRPAMPVPRDGEPSDQPPTPNWLLSPHDSSGAFVTCSMNRSSHAASAWASLSPSSRMARAISGASPRVVAGSSRRVASCSA